LNFLERFKKKPPNIKFNANPSGGSRAAPRGQTDLIKLTAAAFHNFVNAPKNHHCQCANIISQDQTLFIQHETSDFSENQSLQNVPLPYIDASLDGYTSLHSQT